MGNRQSNKGAKRKQEKDKISGSKINYRVNYPHQGATTLNQPRKNNRGRRLTGTSNFKNKSVYFSIK
jgi:hypothetical protein